MNINIIPHSPDDGSLELKRYSNKSLLLLDYLVIRFSLYIVGLQSIIYFHTYRVSLSPSLYIYAYICLCMCIYIYNLFYLLDTYGPLSYRANLDETWLVNSFYLSEYFFSNCSRFGVLFTNPSARAGYDTRSIFKQSLTGFEFRVFLLLD